MTTEAMLKNLRDIARRHGIDILEEMEEWEYSVKVAFLGEFSSGKTSLINALIGRPLFPVFSHPTNAIITEIYKSQDGKPHFIIESTEGEKEIAPADLVKEITSPEPRKVLKAYVDADFLSKNMSIIDTPGASSLEKAHDEVLLKYLPNVDAAFILIDSTFGGITRSVTDFLDLLPDNLLEKVYIVLTKIDLIEPQNMKKIKASVFESLSGIIPNTRVLTVSAKMALEGYEAGDDEKIKKSGINSIKDIIKNEIPKYKKEIYDKRLKDVLVNKAINLKEALEEKLKAIDWTDKELENRIKDVQEEIESLEAKYRKFEKKIEKIHNKSISDISLVIDNTIQEISNYSVNEEQTLMEEAIESMIQKISSILENSIMELENVEVPGLDISLENYLANAASYEAKKVKDTIDLLLDITEILITIWVVPGPTRGLDLGEAIASGVVLLLRKLGFKKIKNEEGTAEKIKQVIKKIDPATRIRQWLIPHFVQQRLNNTLKSTIINNVNNVWQSIYDTLNEALEAEYIAPLREKQKILGALREERRKKVTNANEMARKIQSDIDLLENIIMS